MSSRTDSDRQERDAEVKPVVLSKDEALYPPSKKALIIAGAVGIIALIALIASFVLFPL